MKNHRGRNFDTKLFSICKTTQSFWNGKKTKTITKTKTKYWNAFRTIFLLCLRYKSQNIQNI